MRKINFMIILLLVTVCLILACRSQEPKSDSGNKIKVVVTLFPLYDFTRQIGQDKVDVSLLIPPGVEAHAFEPRPSDMARIEKSDCLVFTGHVMEPWVESLLKGISPQKLLVVDASRSILIRRNDHHADNETHHHGEKNTGHESGADPHIWLDFANAMTMADTITEGLCLKDPAHKAFYMENSAVYKQRLANLDRAYRAALESCRNKTLIHAGHMIFGYLAQRYGLTYVSAYEGFTPNAEPTPQRLAKLAENIKRYNVKAIYYEELIQPRLAETLARETGVPFMMLHGAHNVTKEEMAAGVTFIQLMEKNLENLKKGLPCP